MGEGSDSAQALMSKLIQQQQAIERGLGRIEEGLKLLVESIQTIVDRMEALEEAVLESDEEGDG